MLSWALQDAGIDHAVTGAAAAARLAPFVTAVPVTEVWLSELTDLADAARAANADPVTEGHNVIFRSAKDDAPLMFRERHDGGLASRHLPDLYRSPWRSSSWSGTGRPTPGGGHPVLRPWWSRA